MSRTPRKRPTRADLDTDGYPIRLTDLAHIVGWSTTKLRTDERYGHLTIQWVQCGQKRMPMVERSEAARYIDAFYSSEAKAS